MSTYRKRTQSKPTTAAGLRAQASASGNSIFRSRPRSLSGLFSQSSYSSLLSSSPKSGGGYSPNYLSKSTPSSPSYKSPYSSSNGYSSSYGGTASGYGALTLGLAGTSTGASSTYGSYLSGRPVRRGGSFNKPKSAKLLENGFGSRSSSLQSLAGSEGYASGHERSGRSSRLGSVSSLSSESGITGSRVASSGAVTSNSKSNQITGASENGELDYKKLYEESQTENERLRERLRRQDEQLKEAQGLLDKAQNNKPGLSEAEKRERRAMERKLSEMEEELKMLETLKCENQRLKDENGALIRVISKLSK